jgi:glycosyltransferase involved in cell wall biosynthesis
MPVRMKAALKRLIGADRPKVIAVVGITRADVEAGVAHARSAGETLPIRTWCAEDTTAWAMRRELRDFWPALTIVPWRGRHSHSAFKLLPLTVCPFRVLIFNESLGFFPARPVPIAIHVWRRIWDAALSGARLSADLTLGAGQWSHSVGYRSGEGIRDVAMLVVAFLYNHVVVRLCNWFLLALSLLYQSGEYTVALFRLGVAILERGFEAVLALLAFLVRGTPAKARALYRRRMPGVYRNRAMDAAPDATYTEIVVHGRAWWGRSWGRRIRKANATFVVFRKAGEKASARPLIRMAIECNAFAVARQLAWTGWRDRVTTKHPFRRLLPGEVSRVATPFSSLIAVRRDLIEQLGVPRAITFGAALMLLFQKAAAEGWPSLVAGHADPITQEPAMPLEDAEFVLRSKERYESDVARGNVASSPEHMRPLRGFPVVLIVSPYLPFPLSHGGAVRIYNLCRALADEVDFLLACYREVGETVRYPELHEVFREVHVVDIDEKNSDASVPKQVADYRNTAMAALVRELARRADVVQLEYTQMAEYRSSAEGRPVILVEHDITFTLYRQLGRDFELWERFESQALGAVDSVWTMSERDRALAIEHGASAGATTVVPNGVDLNRFRPLPRETTGESILFVGSFRHLPNLLAFEALREKIMPEVWARFPRCRVHVIAGPDHEKWALQANRAKLLAADSRIVIHGFVEDVRPAYRECDVVTIPLPVSAGTNIKLMEAMACGRAIVSTPVGCQGLDLVDGADLFVADIGPQFAEAVCRLLADDSKREQISVRARRTAEARFDWDIIARGALNGYRRLMENRCDLPEETSQDWQLEPRFHG